MRFSTVRSKDDLVRLVKRAGILPCFVNELEGFSAEEHIAPEYWFPEEGEGFWEWKGPVIRDSGCAYGKLFKGRAAFMTLEYYREFANYRRNGYDFDALVDEGLARHRDIDVYNKLSEAGSILSTDLMHMCDMKTFNDSIVHLQRLGYVIIADFKYRVNKMGEIYGWGVTRYETPEYHFGAAFTDKVYEHSPEESKEILIDRIEYLRPKASFEEIEKFVKR